MRRMIALVCVMLGLMLLLSGCAAEKKSEPLHIVVATQALNDEALTRFETQIESELPQFGDIAVTGVRLGAYSSKELMHICAMIEEKAIDVLIADEVAAKRAGDSGESYFTLDEVFDAQEIASWGLEQVSVPIVGMDGKLTGEESALCGVKLGDGANTLLGLTDMRMYILINTTRLDAAKEMFSALAVK